MPADSLNQVATPDATVVSELYPTTLTSPVPFEIDAALVYRLVTCTVCGLGRLNPLPDAETIRGFYPPEYYGVTGSKFVPLVESLVRLGGARAVGGAPR